MTISEGGCACGKSRYKMSGTPMIVHCCHCSWCQRETGSSYAVNVLIEADQVALISGAVETIVMPTNSGQGQRIVRCRDCHVALWSHYAYAGVGDFVKFVRAGTLDQANRFPPDVHIYVESKQPWVSLPDDVPAYEQYYRAGSVWSSTSLERRERLRSYHTGSSD